MPITGLSYVTVTGVFVKADNTPARGTVRFRLQGRLVGEGDIVVPSDVSAPLVNGTFSVSLAATDDPDFLPQGLYWQVTEFVEGNTRTYLIALPASPSTISLAQLAPVDALDPGARYTLSPNVEQFELRLEAVEAEFPVEQLWTTATAFTALSGERVVCPRDDGSVTYADFNDGTQKNRPLWLTVGAWNISTTATLLTFGPVVFSGWSWVTNGAVFLGHNGALTQTPPVSTTPAVFSRIVGEAVTPTSLFFNPAAPIIL